ncbi:radical SAM protein [Desulfosporosinus sp. FKB]|uniref:B12-binding domain-containing radical SAM protein n=1 Tax=Desulfosporosinus sp. FKB TaxID=1969835 RepID=UPI001482A7EA|nr:radical SAM protein [Desulfosporosinus sp. FKB]
MHVAFRKIMLINPPAALRLWEPHSENLGLGYLAAVLRQLGYQVIILDASLFRLDVSATLKRIQDQQPDVIGFRLLDVTMPYAIDLVARLRRGGYLGHITAGGPVATMMGPEILNLVQGLDSLMVGEGEETLPELLAALNSSGSPKPSGDSFSRILGLCYREGGVIRTNGPRPLIENLDALPFPTRDTLPHILRWGRLPMIISSRGCDGHCVFCCPAAMNAKSPGSKWRPRSAGNVVDEMEDLQRRYNVNHLDFLDDNFFGGGEVGIQRAWDFIEELRRRGLRFKFSVECRVDNVEEDLFRALRDVGCVEVRLGIESGVQRILDRYGKGTTVEQNREVLLKLKEWGLPVKIGFIPFDPSISFTELLQNGEFLRSVGYPEAFNYNKIEVVVGTPLERLFEKERRLTKPKPWIRDYTFDDPTVALMWKVVRGYVMIKRGALQLADGCKVGLADLQALLRGERVGS